MGDCLLYGGLTPSGSVILVLSAGIYTNDEWVLNFYNPTIIFLRSEQIIGAVNSAE